MIPNSDYFSLVGRPFAFTIFGWAGGAVTSGIGIFEDVDMLAARWREAS